VNVPEPFVRAGLLFLAADLPGDGQCRLMMRAGVFRCFLREGGLAEAVACLGFARGLGGS
jgi:hypothetical protein